LERRRVDAEKRGRHAELIRIDWQDTEGTAEPQESETRILPFSILLKSEGSNY
jgi:hypothetical protein